MKKLILALVLCGCNALPVGETDESLTGTTGRIAQPQQLTTISIDSIEPTLPVEQRPVFLHFTLNNSTSRSRTGSVQVRYTQADGSIAVGTPWYVSMAPYSSTQGILHLQAPSAAASVPYTVHYFDDGATAPSESTPVSGAFPVALRTQLTSGAMLIERTADNFAGDNLDAYLTTSFDGAQIDAQGEKLGFFHATGAWVSLGQTSPAVDLIPGSSDRVGFDAWIALLPTFRTLGGYVNTNEQVNVVEEKLDLSADNIRNLIPDNASSPSVLLGSDWCGYQPNLTGADCGGPAYSIYYDLLRVPKSADTMDVPHVAQIQTGASLTILNYRWDATQIVSGGGSIVYVNGSTTYLAPSTPTLAKIAFTQNGYVTYLYVGVR
jgi:hypothetical protein